jgi:DNA-binding NtrC family response regulator
VAAGTFRRDLYHRLCTHHVRIPSLRERKGDIPLLFNHFLQEAASQLEKQKPAASREIYRLLLSYEFPGNARELRAMVYDAVSTLRLQSLSLESFSRAMQASRGKRPFAASTEVSRNPFSGFVELPTFSEAAGFLVLEAMDRAGKNQTIAARLLGISQPALSKRLKQLRSTTGQ